MSAEPAVDAELEITTEGHLGIITLNRPSAVNALSLGMVRGISRQLQAWRLDDSVRAVLFEGRGPKGFCSGGDVRWIRSELLAGHIDRGLDFFEDEYEMNGDIAGYPKPVVALCSGVVMGGGIGIAGHADFRFAVEGARFAMPESAIGFVCDVGTNAILARAPLHRALLFLLLGVPVGTADALALGLTDCRVADGREAHIRRGVATAAETADPASALVRLMQSEGIEAGEPSLCVDADVCIEELTLGTAAEIVEALKEAAAAYPQLGGHLRTLERRCPASLEAIVQSHHAARRLTDLSAVLELDLRLARFMALRSDFDEGVRAVLVDKQDNANWSPPEFDLSVAQSIASEISAVEMSRRARSRQVLSTS